MRSWKLGRIFGISVYVHWSFWILVLWILVDQATNFGIHHGIAAVLFLLSVFGCVLLHELGHSLAALKFGIPTRDITLLPIGGVARLERIPDVPVQELIIAIAGPLVNVVIALSLIPLSIGLGSSDMIPTSEHMQTVHRIENPVLQLIAVNVVLVLFNMLPVFPMDGGRVLRSLMAMRMGNLRATEIAARIGRFMAGLFIIVGILRGQFTLVLLGIFVLFAGLVELFAVRSRTLAGQVHSGSAFPHFSFSATRSRHREPSPEDAEENEQVIEASDVRRLNP